MLDRISAFLKNSTTAWQSWRTERQTASASGFCSLTVSPQSITLLHAVPSSAHMIVDLCESVKISKSQKLTTLLASLVNKYDLKHSPCIWILDAKDYQLFHMEVLPVAPEEFQAAIRWKLKGNLPFGIEDAMIDKFDMPVPKIMNAQKMMTAVVTKESYISSVVSQIKASGLNLNIIDIPELALRNITACFEMDDQTSALLNLGDTSGQLVITRKSELYFSRRFDLDMNLLSTSIADEQNILEKLALEVQRSFDYFHTQWRSQFPERVFLVSPQSESEKIASSLSSFLGTPVLNLPLDNLLVNQSGVPIEHSPNFLPLIGGLLREEMIYATRN